MTRKKVWRYYCEHCKRSGCSGGHIRRHEESCTANPNRICRFHEAMKTHQPHMEALVATVKEHGDDAKGIMAALRDAADNCPACILSALRQSGIQREWADRLYQGDDNAPVIEFSFRAEVAEFWDSVNAQAYQESMRDDYCPL